MTLGESTAAEAELTIPDRLPVWWVGTGSTLLRGLTKDRADLIANGRPAVGHDPVTRLEADLWARLDGDRVVLLAPRGDGEWFQRGVWLWTDTKQHLRPKRDVNEGTLRMRSVSAATRRALREWLASQGGSVTDKPHRHGSVTLQFTFWCGACEAWEQFSEPSLATAKRAAKAKGWRLTRTRGWLDPSCAVARA